MTELSKEEFDALVRGTDELMSETSAGEQEVLAGHEVRRLEVTSSQPDGEDALLAELSKFIDGRTEVDHWIMFSDCVEAGLKLELGALKEKKGRIQEAEFYLADLGQTLKIRRIAGTRFLLNVYTCDGSGGKDMVCTDLSVCVRQDLAHRNGVKGKICYRNWYRMSSEDAGRIEPYVQQFIGFSREA